MRRQEKELLGRGRHRNWRSTCMQRSWGGGPDD
jgi:hypothetical protein